jgi:polyisoprenoid-binding protein YceI
VETYSDVPSSFPDQPILPLSSQHLERWEIDKSRSVLTFSLRQLLIHRITGVFGFWGGSLLLDRQQPSLSSVGLWVDLDSVDTRSSDRDTHICSADFFDVARYPRATFQSTSVRIGDRALSVTGPLSFHGIVRDIELSITPMAMPESATIGQRETFVMKAMLRRKDFGLRLRQQDMELADAAVGDHVELRAQVEVVRMVDSWSPTTG